MTALDDYITVKEKITGDITVKQNSQYNDLDVQTVTVAEGVKARLFGTVHRLLIIKKNSKVFLHGHLLGRVEDEGGRLYHFDE